MKLGMKEVIMSRIQKIFLAAVFGHCVSVSKGRVSQCFYNTLISSDTFMIHL
jgi:hypothetical protein